MATYSYSLASDFGGATGLNQYQFHIEVNTEAGITGANLIGVHLTGDDIDIEFDGALSGGENTALDNLVSNHIPDNTPELANFYSSSTRKHETNSTSYSNLGSFKYDGSDKIGTIDAIDVISHMSSSVTTHDVRIYDRTNQTVIAEGIGFTNIEEAISNLGAISNVPTSKAVLEIHAKRNGGSGNSKSVYVDQVIIYYNN